MITVLPADQTSVAKRALYRAAIAARADSPEADAAYYECRKCGVVLLDRDTAHRHAMAHAEQDGRRSARTMWRVAFVASLVWSSLAAALFVVLSRVWP